jgi:hypothetical protein
MLISITMHTAQVTAESCVHLLQLHDDRYIRGDGYCTS